MTQKRTETVPEPGKARCPECGAHGKVYSVHRPCGAKCFQTAAIVDRYRVCVSCGKRFKSRSWGGRGDGRTDR